MTSFSHKTAVITGASSGIGLATARALAADGCHVALLARDSARLDRAETSIRTDSPPARLLSVPCDVADEAAVAAAFARIEAELGPVDFLVNNAGTGFGTDLAKASLDDWRRIMEVNTTGVFLCTRAVLPGMKARRAGHIVNVSSIVGKVSNPTAPVYCASKHALNGLTEGLFQQVKGDGIKVSLVSPSGTDTAYWDGRTIDRSKLLKDTDVAAAIVFILGQPPHVLIKDIDLTAFVN